MSLMLRTFQIHAVKTSVELWHHSVSLRLWCIWMTHWLGHVWKSQLETLCVIVYYSSMVTPSCDRAVARVCADIIVVPPVVRHRHGREHRHIVKYKTLWIKPTNMLCLGNTPNSLYYVILTIDNSVGRDSLFGIATRCRLDGLGIQSQWGRDVSYLSRWVPGLFLGVQQSEHGANNSFPSSAGLQMVRIYNHRPTVSVRACHDVTFIFIFSTLMTVAWQPCQFQHRCWVGFEPSLPVLY